MSLQNTKAPRGFWCARFRHLPRSPCLCALPLVLRTGIYPAGSGSGIWVNSPWCCRGPAPGLGETFSEGSFESLPAGFAALGNVTEPQTPLVSLLCLIGEWESRDCGIPDWVRLGRARLESPPCSSRAIPGHRAQECLECPREGRSNTSRPLLK